MVHMALPALMCAAGAARADLPMPLRALPANTFAMGARVCSGAPYASDELPVHAVTAPRALRCAVRGAYNRCMFGQ